MRFKPLPREPLPRGGMLDAPGSNPGTFAGSSPAGAAIYIDDESGREVAETWWPGDPLPDFTNEVGT